jgi:dTDP-4-dehydrorhamnose 3,5-epimerase
MTSDVIGVDELLAKKSAVDQSGNLRNQPIEGVIFRTTRPVPHQEGHVTEVARAS